VKMGQKAKEMMTLKFSPQKCSQEWVDFLVRTSHGN